MIGVIALIISLISVTFVIIDKLKVWGDSKRIKQLKKDKAVLLPLVNVKIDDYATVRTEKNGPNTSTVHSAHYSKFFNLIQGLNTDSLYNRNIAGKIEGIKSQKSAGKLFECKGIPDGENFSTQFTPEVNEILCDVRKYLAEVL